jgi:hypothetical protein
LGRIAVPASNGTHGGFVELDKAAGRAYSRIGDATGFVEFNTQHDYSLFAQATG